ncbi:MULTISPECIES: hypothetical protein [Trichococcus]|uniref:hypothetical protein n=1 Tax=Trichococcus TaxID=82802 RepID=UPI0012EE3408|nr:MULTISPECIES: hypothetical protein [Trichococcus]
MCCIWFAAAATPASLRIVDDSEAFCIFVTWLSDSFGLSDNRIIVRALVVRFFRVVGQLHRRPGAGCPILSGYRTTASSAGLWLSDSSGLSDIRIIVEGRDVRFFRVIGQSPDRLSLHFLSVVMIRAPLLLQQALFRFG